MNQQASAKKVANNILEFLIDPTVIPVRQRLYFRPEEILKNEVYEGAKADAQKAYGDQRQNSDFYPIRNRTKSQKEGSVMDRRTMIASLDVLAQNFAENDPIATDLRTMAYAVSKESDEEFEARMAADTFTCPDCGTKVLEKTKYCVKCKKKVEPKAAAAGDEKAVCPKCGKAECGCMKEASEEVTVKDFWTKEASDAVAKALVADAVESPAEEQQEEHEKSETPEEEAKEKGKEAGKIKGPGIPDGTGPMSKTPECQMNKKEEKEAGQNDPKYFYQKGKKDQPAPAPKVEATAPVEAKKEVVPPAPAAVPAPEEKEAKKEVVDTSVLAVEKFDDIELTAGMIDTELTADEKAQLDQLFK